MRIGVVPANLQVAMIKRNWAPPLHRVGNITRPRGPFPVQTQVRAPGIKNHVSHCYGHPHRRPQAAGKNAPRPTIQLFIHEMNENYHD